MIDRLCDSAMTGAARRDGAVALLRDCRRLRVVACAFRIPEHIDIAACTRRGIWVTNVMTQLFGAEAELEAALNILDVLSGDTPRGALNEILQPAA